MAFTSFTTRYNQNTRERRLVGDLLFVIYDVTIEVGSPANTYPLGGEPVDFSADFNEVHAVIPDLAFSDPAIGAGDANGGYVPKFQRAAAPNNVNQGFIRFYEDSGGNNPLSELAAGAYPFDKSFTLLVCGRPATDAS
jgi:hypothetical protein